MSKFYKLLFSLIVGFFLLSVDVLYAQSYQVQGTVTDTKSNQGIAGVNVIIKGTYQGTVTDIDGHYKLTVDRDPAILQFSFVGYTDQEIEVSSSKTQVDVEMKEDIANLDEVVVTGLATNVKRSNLANSVASIPSKELTGISSPQTVDNALYGKFKGATITSNSGAPGGGISIKLRGLTSINGSNQPLIIMDGVYLDNSSIPAGLNAVSQAAGGGSQSNQDNPSNRLADIDPNDIESIEILKGASAAAIYGSRASGGVVIITTKKGSTGKPRINLSQSIGVTTILKKLGQRTWTFQRAEDAFGTAAANDFKAAEAAGKVYDYEDALYGNNGMLFNTRLSISGGSEKTSYFVGTSRKDEEGIVKNTGYKKTSFRLNLDQNIVDGLDLSLNTNYIESSADRGFFNNDNTGTTMGVSFVNTPAFAQLFPDANGNYPDNPYAGSNFLQTRDLITNNENVKRFIGGGKITAKLLTNDVNSLKMVLSGGLDSYTLYTKAIFPNTLQFEKNGNGLNGVSVQGTTQNQNTNVSAFLVHDFFPKGSAFSFTTQAGVTQQDFYQNTILGTASNMNGTQTNLDQSGNISVAQNRLLQQDKGFFVQEEVNFGDKFITTLGIRGDKSSNNGDVNKFYYYPKASLAINVNEFSFWSFESINQLKLRVAYGQAGNFATFGSKYTSLGGVVIDGISGTQISQLLGNDKVAPERQSELEFGLDLAALQNKISFNATYYIKTVQDLLLYAQVPSSSGFTNQVTNAADLQNKGIELGLDLNIFSKKNLNWNATINFWKNQGKITRLDVPTFTRGGFADFLGQFRIKEGHSPTEIIGFGPNPDEDGYVVFGDAEPNFQMTLLNNIRFKSFELSMLWHWKNGGDNINLTYFLSDLAGTSPDYDKIDLDPEGKVPNGVYRPNQVFGGNTGVLIEDASYLRMREIGLYYTLPEGAFFGNFFDEVKVGLSANNLVNFFSYSGYDPEVSNFGGGGLSTGVDVTPYPSSKRMNFHISFKF